MTFNWDGGWYLEHGREKGRLFILVTPNFFHQILMLALPPWGDNFKHMCFLKKTQIILVYASLPPHHLPDL